MNGISVEIILFVLISVGNLFCRKTLADLAAWEPRTFESLALISREKAAQDALHGLHEKEAKNNVYFHNEDSKQNEAARH